MQMPFSRSFWLDEALATDTAELAPTLDNDIRTDVCIVGGGYTGLWTAIRIKEAEPAIDVVLIEKDLCGSGASGRNAGFLLSVWAKFTSLQKICGDTEAVRLSKASADAVGDVMAFCEQNAIDADVRPGNALDQADHFSAVSIVICAGESLLMHQPVTKTIADMDR